MKSDRNSSSIHQHPVELLQELLRFDTSNPPGNEAECISYINGLLTNAGIQTILLEKTPGRPNLVARLAGKGNAAPLLLYGHVDVVTTQNQKWLHPPFSGIIADGCVWGRGALDMKGGVAMMLSAFLRAKSENLKLPGDVVLNILSDEETGGDCGAQYLVKHHADLFKGIRYAIGEFGGFSFYVGSRRFYMIMVSEKQACWMKATVRGPGGHGSMPVRGGAMAKLSRLLNQLDRHRLPVHITPIVRRMVKTIAQNMGGISGLALNQLLNPVLTNGILNAIGDRGRLFDPLLHNTVSPTILQGSSQINVIPGEVSVQLDGRLLPGYTFEDMKTELKSIIGDDVELEILRYDPGPTEPDMGMFDTLSDILRQADPDGIPVPFLLSGVTDGRFFSKLGIQTYGFLPMKLPKDFNFTKTIHGTDERIPVAAVEFGANAIYKLLQSFG
ncbi:MAG: M20/M25/M40 family metallo-hydrolase [Desulfobacterales bacterium]|jgi:acetylornithine deacetylase/succinyl-diaminopimelate desuccinylase-like protein|nr:M20/M25/M40 family metallo-hydrolase [Desulfobacterales bacterium]